MTTKTKSIGHGAKLRFCLRETTRDVLPADVVILKSGREIPISRDTTPSLARLLPTGYLNAKPAQWKSFIQAVS